MLKKITLETLDIVGAAMVAFAALSGVVMYLSGGMTEPTLVWFAPMFLTPLAVAGVALMLISSLVSKKDRGLLAWSALAFVVVLVHAISPGWSRTGTTRLRHRDVTAEAPFRP